MKTIKIIDLLNKIANGEEVPKRIVIRGSEFEYYGNSSIERYYKSPNDTNWMVCIDIRPFDEVEILDEEDEFEDIEHYDMFDYFGGYDFGGTDKELLCDLQSNFEHINNELDKLIKNQKKIIERLNNDN